MKKRNLGKTIKTGFCRVEFYAGHKSCETPRVLVWRGRKIEIESIRGRRRVLDVTSGRIRDVFECRVQGRRAVISRPASGPCRIRFLDPFADATPP